MTANRGASDGSDSTILYDLLGSQRPPGRLDRSMAGLSGVFCKPQSIAECTVLGQGAYGPARGIFRESFDKIRPERLLQPIRPSSAVVGIRLGSRKRTRLSPR